MIEEISGRENSQVGEVCIGRVFIGEVSVGGLSLRKGHSRNCPVKEMS